MPPRGVLDDDTKSHEQKKRNPRRLFSFDSIKSNNSSRRSSSDNEVPKTLFRSPLNTLELSNVQEGVNETKYLANDHPGFVEEPADINPTQPDHASSSTRLEPVRPPSISSQHSIPDNAPSLPSNTATGRARWDHLRQHVLPGLVRPLTPVQKQTIPQASVSGPPSRPQTPKPSGLARIGFRQVVEHARDLDNDTRKFGKEILKACAAARYAETTRSTKDKDGQLSATTTLSGSVASASTATTGKKMDYFPQSIASLASHSPSTLSGSTISPSLKPLYQVLIYHSRLLAGTGQRIFQHLPHESHILGTLLCPFLTPSKYPTVKGEEEKATAVEAFELILRIWTPIDEVGCCPIIMKIMLTSVHQVRKCRALLMVY